MQKLSQLIEISGLRPWFKAVPILISIIALYFAWNANIIAVNTQRESSRQFISVNKPIIVVKQIRFDGNKGYFDIVSIQDGKITIATLISIQNIGSIIAGNVFIHSMTSHLFIDGVEVERLESNNQPLNKGDNLSLLNIPPKEAITKMVTATFQIPAPYRTRLRNNRIRLVQNMLLYYYPDTIQTPNKEAEAKLYATNITNTIHYNWYDTTLLTFLDKPSLSMLGKNRE